MTVVLVVLAVLGARSVFFRLTSRGVNVALALVLALGIATFLLLHLVLPGGSTLVVALVGLALAWSVVADLSPRSWAGTGASAPPRPQADVPRSSSGARCPLCVKSDGVGKRIYANENEAWAAVRGAQARRAAGKAAPDLRRAYREERCGNWHVTSQD